MVTTQANGRPAVAGQDRRPSLVTLAATLAPAWLPLLTLIFGGCCSNAVFLELSTRQAPQLGTLITLLQFFFTMLLALPAQLERAPSSSPKTSSTGGIPFVGWRLKSRAVPMSRWAVQVVLYATTSLLNNVAFAYEVPMPVHIIFRSGGLVVNMLMGWVVKGRRYPPLQVLSVILVTGGVVLSTLSTQPSTPSTSSAGSAPPVSNYLTGISLLTLALFLSSLMGLWQEATFAVYGRDTWREALFYSHALSLPLVLGTRYSDVRGEVQAVLESPQVVLPSLLGGAAMPSLIPLLTLNVLTQLACINGVNRLTARVSSVAVTLVLVVRKAASLAISVLVLNRGKEQGDTSGLVTGAIAVGAGTVMYAWAASRSTVGVKKETGEAGQEEKQKSADAAVTSARETRSTTAATKRARPVL